MNKICNNCRKRLTLDNFHKKPGGKFGYNSICKICRKNKRLEGPKRKKIPELVRCANCKELKTINKFYRKSSSVSGYQSYCKKCQRSKIKISKSKIENYSKIVLKKFGNLNKEVKINISYLDILNRFRIQDGKCQISKHELEHESDMKGRTDNIWNFSILPKENVKEINSSDDFILVINLIYSIQKIYKYPTTKILEIYRELFDNNE